MAVAAATAEKRENHSKNYKLKKRGKNKERRTKKKKKEFGCREKGKRCRRHH